MNKCNCLEPADNDKIITFCGRCNGVVIENNNEIEYLTPKTFEDAVRPLMKWMAENYHPHTKIIVESNKAEIVEGIKVINTNEFLID